MTHAATPTDDNDSGEAPDNAIAIVGWAAHLPGSTSIDDFWSNLEGGIECIRRFTDQELEAAGIEQALLSNPHYVKANGVLDDMEGFDADFFGLSPRDAAVMDPQTRHFLECAWHALESAGHAPRQAVPRRPLAGPSAPREAHPDQRLGHFRQDGNRDQHEKPAHRQALPIIEYCVG